LLSARRCSWLDFSLRYEAPGFLLFDFKRPQADINRNLTPAVEIAWHSPRVPAYAASAVPECAGIENVSRIIHNCHLCPLVYPIRPVQGVPTLAKTRTLFLLVIYRRWDYVFVTSFFGFFCKKHHTQVTLRQTARTSKRRLAVHNATMYLLTTGASRNVIVQ